jgi:muramidase (phage lysozyme)
MESGVGLQNPLFFIGVIENNNDPRKEGRVQVRAFGVHGTNKQVPRDELPWAIVMQGGYDPNVIPKLNSWVFGIFLDGRDAQEPMVMGLIPTQYATIIDPDKNGWGFIPDRDGVEAAHGSAPNDVMQPQNSRYTRGEYIQETQVLTQEMGRTVDVKVGGTEETWDQPSSAYNTQYPHNRVWETAHHSIELDDTPGGERVTVRHKSGSFIEIDSRGTTTNKTVGDHFDVMDRKQHVVVGGMSTVTIMGNSYVYVRGNKIEEIEGDLKTLVHGNHMISVGGQSIHQAGEQVSIRGGDVRVNANAGTLSINAQKELQLSGGDLTAGQYGAISMKAEKILVDATDKLGLRGLTQVNIQSVAEMNLSAITINQLATTWSAKSAGSTFISSGVNTDIDAGISMAIKGGVTADIDAPIVNIDTFVNLAGGLARPATAAAQTAIATADFLVPPVNQTPFEPGSATPEIAWYAEKVEAPEPVAKSTSILPRDNPGSRGSTGYSALDNDGSGGGGASSSTTIGDITAATQNASTPLLDFIGNKESEGYDDISGLISQSRYPSKPITQMTIQEILDWQESIDQYQLSEAVGRYQIMEDTLRGYNNDSSAGPGNPLYTRAGLSAGDLFSPQNQDKLALVLLNQRGLQRFVDGEITREQFANNLAAEWASLPLVTGPNAGRSVYAGDSAGNRALTTVAEFLAAIDAVKANVEDPDSFDPRGES